MRTGLLPFVDYSLCGNEAKPKPDPDMLNQLLNQCQLSAQEAIMIGDTSFDLDMAAHCSMRAIGLTTGGHTADTLRRSHPMAICASITELKQHLIP